MSTAQNLASGRRGSRSTDAMVGLSLERSSRAASADFSTPDQVAALPEGVLDLGFRDVVRPHVLRPQFARPAALSKTSLRPHVKSVLHTLADDVHEDDREKDQ
jgi:hypothetical protein